MKKREKHLFEYLVLLMGLSVILILFYLFRTNHDILKIISGVGSAFYVTWGLVHHASEGRLTRLIALEYVLVGSLAFLILFTALNF